MTKNPEKMTQVSARSELEYSQWHIFWACGMAVLYFLAIPPLAQAQDFTWTTNADDTITITSYTGAGGDVVIPTTIEDKFVTIIGTNAFLWNDTVTRVSIPAGITNIENGAFLFCHGLEAFDVAATNSCYSSLNGVLYNKDQQTLLNYPGGKAGDYSIPPRRHEHYEGCIPTMFQPD